MHYRNEDELQQAIASAADTITDEGIHAYYQGVTETCVEYYCHHSSNLTGLQETPSLCSYLTSLWQTTFKGHGLLYPYHKQINLCLNLWNGQAALLLV